MSATMRSRLSFQQRCMRPCSRRAVVACHATASEQRKQRLVFLGTPEVAATALQILHRAAQQEGSGFEIAAVVSQPGKPRGRGNKSTPLPTPVEQVARDLGLPDEAILCPKTAKEEAFLTTLRDMSPDLCVTAAYGNMLPQAFLDIPRLGTLNIHPSLLPKYRGAAPVQRAVQDGVAETGVSVAYTVLKCDAGPVLAQDRVALDPDIQAPELLAQLFERGSQLLVRHLPDVFQGKGPQMASPQDEAQVLHAAKLSKEEGLLDFSAHDAQVLHNKVRAFAGWPGTSARFTLQDEATGSTETVEVKVVRTAVARDASVTEVTWSAKDTLLVPCAQGTTLEVLQVQPPTKKVMAARDWHNGIRKKRLALAALETVAA